MVIRQNAMNAAYTAANSSRIRGSGNPSVRCLRQRRTSAKTAATATSVAITAMIAGVSAGTTQLASVAAAFRRSQTVRP